MLRNLGFEANLTLAYIILKVLSQTEGTFNNIVGLGHLCNAETFQWKSCPSFSLLQVIHKTYFWK